MSTKQVIDIHNLPSVITTMQLEVYDKLLFSTFTKDMRPGTASNTGSESFELNTSIVARLDGSKLVSGGTDHFLMPMLRELRQPARYGSQYLTGTGEPLRHLYRKVYINQVSGTVSLKKSEMDKLRTDVFEQNFKNAVPQLSDWFAKILNANFIASIYEGYSTNLTTGLAEAADGIGVKASYHPNMYISSTANEVAEIGTAGNTKTAAEINTAVASAKTVTHKTLYAYAEALAARRVQKVNMEGSQYWLALINMETLHNLLIDSVIRGDIHAIASGSMYNNMLFKNNAYRWGDFLFMVDNTAARKWHDATHGFEGLNGYRDLPTVASNVNNTITVLGANALSYAEAKPIWMKQEESNFGQQVEVAALNICGVARNDWVDKGDIDTIFSVGNTDKGFIGSTPILNQSSAVLIVK